MSESVDRDGAVAQLAVQMRQALRGCVVHTVGPVAAFARCVSALERGVIDRRQFAEIGCHLEAQSAEQLERHTKAGNAVQAEREQQLLAYARQMFSLQGAAATMPTPRGMVGVVGKGRRCPDDVRALAYGVGAAVAGRAPGHAVVTGGLGGTMRAAAHGASESGALVVSLLPGAAHRNVAPHEYAHLSINTGMPVQIRNVVLASTVDLMVALPGSHGTWQEMAVALDEGTPVWAVGAHAVRIPEVEYLDSLDDLEHQLSTWCESRSATGEAGGDGSAR